MLNPFEFFTSRVRAGLHIVLSMDPADAAWPSRTESNPALFTRCSLHWMDTWSEAGGLLRTSTRTLIIVHALPSL
jgi:dynein heavy chain 2